MLIFDYLNFREYLKELLKFKQQRNSRVSLRSMSKLLEVAPSTLSGLMNGKVTLTLEMALHLAKLLRLKRNEKEYFLLLARYELADEIAKPLISEQLCALALLAKRVDLSEETFRFFNEWYHVAILEMTALPGFELTAANVSEKIGIEIMQAQSAIERLKRLKLIVLKEGAWKKSNRFFRFSSEKKNEAIRSFHRQMLTRTITAVEAQGPDERYIGTETFAMPPDRLDQAKAIMDRCFDELLKLSTTDQPNSVVFHAGAHLYQIRKEKDVS